MALSQQTQRAKFWHQTLLMEFKIHTLRTNLECKDSANLSALYGFAIKEDQKQKIRELDFGSSSPQASAQCDINAVKGSGCFKCGNNDHFMKDCPLNRDNDKKDGSPSPWPT